jgi:hypothetical protein
MHDDLLRRLRELNPVPDPDRYVALGEPDWPADPVLRAVLEQASTTNHRPRTTRLGPGRDPAPEERPMPTLTPPRKDETAQPEQRPRRRWLLAAAAIIVVVLMAGGLFTLVGSPFDDAMIAPVTTEPESDAEQTSNAQAIEAAEAYIDARNSYDPERARELVTDTFVTSEVPDAYTLRTMELAFETHEAYGFQYVDGTCEVIEPGPEIAGREPQTRVNCDYGWTTELQRITDYPPVAVTFVFHVENGLIDRIDHNWNSFAFEPNVYDPWLTFLGMHYPEGRIDAVATHELEPERTRRFIDRAPEYLASYEAWVEERER